MLSAGLIACSRSDKTEQQPSSVEKNVTEQGTSETTPTQNPAKTENISDTKNQEQISTPTLEPTELPEEMSG